MMEQVHVLGADLIEVVGAFDAPSPDFHPVTVFPVTARCADFAQVDFGVEVGGKRIAVVAAVAVEDVDGVDGVKFVFGGIGRSTPA